MGIYYDEEYVYGVLIDRNDQSVCLDDLPERTNYLSSGSKTIFYNKSCETYKTTVEDFKNLSELDHEYKDELTKVFPENEFKIWIVKSTSTTYDSSCSCSYDILGSIEDGYQSENRLELKLK